MNTQQPKVEFLVSTMNRTDLSFLDSMFKNFDLNTINILIINQTSEHNNLLSHNQNIRVLNSYERGLSKSRNLALKNAIGEICFIADDDVEYAPKAIDTALKAHKIYPEAALISVQFIARNGKKEILYQKDSGVQNSLLHKQHLHSIEITLKPEILLINNIQFNTCFGIGALFQSGEEQILRDDLIQENLQVVYINEPIVKHMSQVTIAYENTREFTRSITAVKYRLHKNLIYLWLIRYIWLLLKRKLIKLSQCKQFWIYGIKAVNDYKRYCKK